MFTNLFYFLSVSNYLSYYCVMINPLLSCINEMAKDFFVNNKNTKRTITTNSSKDYQPFVKVSDISSLGRSHRVFGHKTKRTHHLLSGLELAVFFFSSGKVVLKVYKSSSL